MGTKKLKPVNVSEKAGTILRQYGGVLLGLLVLVLVVHDIFGTHGVLAMRRSQVEARQIRSEIKKLDDENKRLENNAKDLKSDPATIEGQARANGLKRPGEVVFQISPKQPDATSGAPANNSVPKN